jgi:N-[(2S)-2-amino-2-carboxyethyl]-L-glutamate dehydrogenase
VKIFTDEHSGADVLYLPRRDVIQACSQVDVVGTVARALEAHARGATVLPDEAYMGWDTADGFSARCLAMPGGIEYPARRILGLKVINASLGNAARGLPRSQGFTMIFDPETSRPLVIMEAAYISALRTAAVTAVTAHHLAVPNAAVMALIGCGTLAKAHLALLPQGLSSIRQVRLFDVRQSRAEELAKALADDADFGHLDVVTTTQVRDCVRGAHLVVPVTTVTEGYLPLQWLMPGAVVAHVSLDDVLPDVVTGASLVLVDDWGLVSHDEHRLLGRMYREGTLLAPDGSAFPGCAPVPSARRVDGTLGEALIGSTEGRRKDSDIILSNPFGMSVLDVAVAEQVYRSALDMALGHRLLI